MACTYPRQHYSQVFDETRHYRIFLPPDYETSDKRYPVVYWFHGWSERYKRLVQDEGKRNYDLGADYGGDNIANFVGTHLPRSSSRFADYEIFNSLEAFS